MKVNQLLLTSNELSEFLVIALSFSLSRFRVFDAAGAAAALVVPRSAREISRVHQGVILVFLWSNLKKFSLALVLALGELDGCHC